MPAAKRLAYSYIRLSSERQLQGDSVRRQTELSTEYALKHGLRLAPDAAYQDLGVSAFKGRNVADGALGKFVAAAKSGLIPKGSFLLVESIDRLSRQNISKALVPFVQIVDAGISIVTLQNDKIYSDESSLADWIGTLLEMERSHSESALKGKRVGAAWKNKKKNAGSKPVSKICPGWLQANKRGFDLIKDKAAIVRKIYKWSSEGMGDAKITAKLIEDHVPAFGAKGGKNWQKSYVTKILNNRAVIGEYMPHSLVNGKRVPDGSGVANYYPRVVSDELFNKAQAARVRRKVSGTGRKGRNFTNLFSKLVKCGKCGSTMHYLNKGDGLQYLSCDNARRKLGCTANAWNYKRFERAFLTYVSDIELASLFGEDKQAAERQERLEDIETIKAQLASAKRKRDTAYDLKDRADDTDYVIERLNEATALVHRIEAKLQREEEALKLLDNTNESFSRKSQDEFRGFIARLQDAHGDTYELRANVSNKIHAIVDEIRMFPDQEAFELRKLKDDSSTRYEVGSFDLKLLGSNTDASEEEGRSVAVRFKTGAWRIKHFPL